MPADSTGFYEVLTDPKMLGMYLMAFVGALATIAKLISIVKPWVATWYASRSIAKRLGAELYTPAEIVRATRHYVRPQAQDIDPAHASEPGREKAVKEDLFAVVDRLLDKNSEFKYSVLLADSGMGKTAFVLNYYRRYLTRRKRFRLELLPLSRKDADERIQTVENKSQKVLFLDALDEDVLAIVDHKQRIRDLCEMAQEFIHILITCRTQFFPTASEEPGATGVMKIAASGAGQSSEYTFHKRYLSPFSDEQVDKYLKKRHALFQRSRRRKARQLVDRIPRLTMRPMLLSYVDELLQADREYKNANQLYEQMIDAWLLREKGKVEGIETDDLLAFCKQLAYELYCNRENYHGDRVSLEGIAPLADKFDLNIETWKLRGRSLLNRDADDNFKFSHRSIMEYLFVRHFLELSTNQRRKLTWTDQMKMFMCDILRDQVIESGRITLNLAKADLSDLPEPIYTLRNTSSNLKAKETRDLIKKHDFFCSSHEWSKNWQNPNGKGIQHLYEATNDGKVVYDALTGLHWQQSGSSKELRYSEAEKYVEKLNRDKFAGYSDWRLPTLEEAMSLVAPKQKNSSLYIDPIFDKTQRWIWTSDKESASVAWVVNFNDGSCYDTHVGFGYVRAVR